MAASDRPHHPVGDGPAPQPAAHDEPFPRRLGWRLRVLAVAALLGCLGLALLVRAVVDMPHVEARWRATPDGAARLASSPLPALVPHAGRTLSAVAGSTSAPAALDALALLPSARWLTDDDARRRHAAQHAALHAAHAAPPLSFVFADGTAAGVEPGRQRPGDLGAAFWLAAGLALALWLAGMVAVLARPGEVAMLYCAMTVCQAGSLLFVALDSSGGAGLPPWTGGRELALRTAFDLATVAAMVHAAAIHPLRLPGSRNVALAGWSVALGLAAAVALGAIAQAWWWTQGAIVAGCAAAAALHTRSYRREPNPSAIVLRRFALVALAGAAALTLALAGTAATGLAAVRHPLALAGPATWTGLLAVLLLLLPFVTRPQRVTREFALLAAVSAVATSLDLLLVALFSLGQFVSLALSLFLTLGVYLGARQWIFNQLLGRSMVTAERMFARLYRTVREVSERPDEMPAAVAGMLRDLFEPLQIELVADRPTLARAGSEGSSLLVPLPALPDDAPGAEAARGAISMRFAGRGRRLFTRDDARLADRLIEQLAIALAFERAVERGRLEERLRIAQDLHDDIGARLLTLMYQAPSPEIEDYLRHTLQDLKTLTRGLAAPSQRLSEAAAEWKAALSQRLTLAGASLDWRLWHDRDPSLTVVQWSALTRVLRELASNVIAHARAQHVDVALSLAGTRLELVVTDDGVGRDPARWSHGLGLSGVRKRVRQLGGAVEWSEVSPSGIRCRVTVDPF